MPLNINIITREAKGSPLTVSELDANFVNLKQGALDSYEHAGDILGGSIDWSQVNFSLDGWLTVKDTQTEIIDLDVDETTYDVDIAASLGAAKSLSLGSGNTSSKVKAKNAFSVESTLLDGLNLLDLKLNATSVFAVDKEGILYLSETSGPDPIINGALYFDGDSLNLGIEE
ncbi:MAG: hypothetical protein CL723_03125 [Chloroflexi bacterium]|jgi:hypothetical protein|nr:hypothetical protein [Chloroflexota bacterium]|tara:strand:+ start:832 stop:1347 length:516 start_codon:yes stop_codon:yes gene_type:complete